ncbi:MAG: ferritin-like domain-containing protein [Planctomycetota bacterium]
MSHDAIIEQLNECLKHEWTGVAQYSQASFIVEGVWREVYAKTLMENAEESFGHAKLVGDKIVALGGVPAATRNEIKQTRDLQQILENSLAFEAKAVEMYGRALEMAEAINDRPLVIFLENILEEEQEGVDEFTKLLRNSDTASSSSVDAKSA